MAMQGFSQDQTIRMEVYKGYSQYKARYNDSINNQCDICGHFDETLEHIILDCSHARKVWKEININIDMVRHQYNSIQEWVMSWFSSNAQLEDYLLYSFMIGAWIIWKDICDAVFQEVSLKPTSSIHKILYYLSPLLHASAPVSNILLVDNVSAWKTPSPGISKINVDASFDADTKQLGISLVLRDHTGTCNGVKGSYSNGALSAEAGECMAVRETLSWAKEKHLTNIHVEAYAKLVILSINGSSLLVQWENRNIIKEIKNLVSSFHSCIFSFVSRSDNQVADTLSKTVRMTASNTEAYESLSSEICSLLAKDFQSSFS